MTFSAISWLGALAVVLLALVRSRAYALFRLVQLSIHTALAVQLFKTLPQLAPVFWFLNAQVLVSAVALVRARDRGRLFRVAINLPAAFYQSSILVSLPWALANLLGGTLPWPWLPLALGGLGLLQSLSAREETVDLCLSAEAPAQLGRYQAGGPKSARPLRLVQITDPHLGPFMSVERLTRIAERALARSPDLVLLTGDFLTMESHHNPEGLRRALAPLAAMPGRVFACLGNHDYEALDLVKDALRACGARLLVDEAELVQTEAGPVQIVGANFVWREREAHLKALTELHPRIDGAFRLVLLHDPGAFALLPDGSADLVLSGHTHGGQIGLVSLGLQWTILRLFSQIPDHGPWARGKNRLYVHRGTGHYGFPVRLGVPAEQSLLLVHPAS